MLNKENILGENTYDDTISIQAVHDVLVSMIPKNKRFVNPRDGSVAIIKQGGQGMNISGFKIAGDAAKCGIIGTLSLTGNSSEKCRYEKRDASMPSEENKGQWKDAIMNMYFALRKSKGGILGQNTLRKTIDFNRNKELTLNQHKYFEMLGLGGEDFPMLDFMDSPAGKPGTKELVAFNNMDIKIPYFLFLSDPNVLVRWSKLWGKKPMTKPAQIIFENGGAAGHNGSLIQKKDTMKTFRSMLREVGDDVYSLLPKLLHAGMFSTGVDLVDSICSYGGSGIQLGTRFTISGQSNAHNYHKRLIIDAKNNVEIPTEILSQYTQEDINKLDDILGDFSYIGKIPSTSGLSATGFRTKFVLDVLLGKRYFKKQCAGFTSKTKEMGCLDMCCLSDESMGLERGTIGDYCIEQCLRDAVAGKETGIYFASKSAFDIPENQINTPIEKIVENIYMEAYRAIKGSVRYSQLAEKLESRKVELNKMGFEGLTHRLFQ